MLLARTAEALYWAGRYLERAQDVARVVLAHGDSHVDLPVGEDVGWAPLLAVIGAEGTWQRPATEAEIVDYLLVDAGNPSSVLSSLAMARENFRTARVVVPPEAWQLCNDLWRAQREDRPRVRSRQGRVVWLRQVVAVCQRLNGALWESMRRDEALAFARIGHYVERADLTCRFLAARAESAAPERPEDPYAEVRGLSVLRALDAYQAFHRARSSPAKQKTVASFVLQDESFPRAVSSCLSEVRQEVKRLPRNDEILAACSEASIKLSGDVPDRMGAYELRSFVTEMIEAVAAVSDVLTATYFATITTPRPPAGARPPLRTKARGSGPPDRPHVEDEAGLHVFRVRHQTTYRYEATAEQSYNEAHLRPRETDLQSCRSHVLDVSPRPVSWFHGVDTFGNHVTSFHVAGPFEVLTVVATSEVALKAPSPPPEVGAWERVRAALEDDRSSEAKDARRFRAASRLVRTVPGLADYALESFLPGRPMLDALVELCHRIRTDFSYEPGFTSVTTPPADVFTVRRGVCQDFAHLLVGALRDLGFAARYVSGYIESATPATEDPLIGADASHAWASVFVPGRGWLDADPTNDQLVTTSHITVAWGRDYSDVSPLRGSVVGGGASHALDVGVSVQRLR